MISKSKVSSLIFNTFVLVVTVTGLVSLGFVGIRGILSSIPIVGKYSISSMTLLTFCVSVCYMIIVCDHVPRLPRILCSLSIPVFGMAFHELFWHVGCRMTWQSEVPGSGIPEFWAVYSVAIYVGMFILDQKYDILYISFRRTLVVVILLFVYALLWMNLYDPNFYRSLLLYEEGLGTNPHTVYHYAVATMGRMMWVLLAPRHEVKPH